MNEIFWRVVTAFLGAGVVIIAFFVVLGILHTMVRMVKRWIEKPVWHRRKR